jgi:hypothetical protein
VEQGEGQPAAGDGVWIWGNGKGAVQHSVQGMWMCVVPNSACNQPGHVAAWRPSVVMRWAVVLLPCIHVWRQPYACCVGGCWRRGPAQLCCGECVVT